jgi:Amino acid kinase family
LAATQVATLVGADWVFLLTDVANLYTANPSVDPTAQPIYEVEDVGKLQAWTTPPPQNLPPQYVPALLHVHALGWERQCVHLRNTRS